MFKIEGVVLFNFKSYRGHHELQFPVDPGLYFLTGKNDAEPTLGSNGAGKSTLLDAVYWCLFGHTTRGLKASDIISWGEATCMVAVNLIVSGDKITIIRKQAPNSLTMNGRTVDQSAIDKAICLNAQSFLYSVILPQFGTPFFDMKPAEKLTLFSDIMGLDFWLEKSNQAIEAAKAIGDTMIKLDSATRGTETWLKTGEENLKEYAEKRTTFEDMRERLITVIQGKIDWANAELKQLTEERHDIVKDLTTCHHKRDGLSKDIDDLNTAKERNIKDRDDLKAESVKIITNIKSIESTIAKLTGMKTVCPHCQQKVNASHLYKEKQQQNTKLNKQLAELGDVNAYIKEVTRVLNGLDGRITETTKNLKNLDSMVVTLKVKLAEIDTKIDGNDTRINELKREIKAKRQEQNPFTQMFEKQKLDVSIKKVVLTKQKDELARLEVKYDATSYWVGGFKRVRLFVIEETLRQLEVEVNNSLTSLGLVDWSIEFDVERENKSGGVTKGFVVFIRCPSNPDPVRWESWSGGETQRLQLAGDFGLANLIMMQAGLTNTIEFYDEPSNHLSDEGLNDLAETLHQRALDDGKTIWLVDHRMPEFGDFKAKLEITKTDDGSRMGAEVEHVQKLASGNRN